MTEPRRLKEEGDDLDRWLLGASASDGPSAASRTAARQALGLGDPPSGGSGAAPAASRRISLAIRALGVVTVAVAIHAAWPTEPPAPSAVALAPVEPRVEPVLAAPISPVIETDVATPPPAERPVARTAPARARLASHLAEPAPSAEPADSLPAQLAAIDEARALTRGGDPQRALQHLEDFDRRFPSAVLAPEAEVARVEALVRDGDLEAARARAARFLSSHAESTATRRIRRLVPDLDPDAHEGPVP